MAQTLTRVGERLKAPPPSGVRRLRHAVGGFLHRVPGARLALLLGPVLLWMVVIYLGSLGLLFVTSFWSQDSVTGDRPELGPDQLPVSGPGGRLPHDSDPDGRDRAGGHHHGY